MDVELDGTLPRRFLSRSGKGRGRCGYVWFVAVAVQARLKKIKHVGPSRQGAPLRSQLGRQQTEGKTAEHNRADRLNATRGAGVKSADRR